MRVVESLPHPAYVAGRRWDVLAWNKAAEEIFAWGRMPEGEPELGPGGRPGREALWPRHPDGRHPGRRFVAVCLDDAGMHRGSRPVDVPARGQPAHGRADPLGYIHWPRTSMRSSHHPGIRQRNVVPDAAQSDGAAIGLTARTAARRRPQARARPRACGRRRRSPRPPCSRPGRPAPARRHRPDGAGSRPHAAPPRAPSPWRRRGSSPWQARVREIRVLDLAEAQRAGERSIVVSDGLTSRPCSSRTYQSTPMPASSATSSRRRPGVRRRRVAGRPTVSGRSRCRRERRKSPSSLRRAHP